MYRGTEVRTNDITKILKEKIIEILIEKFDVGCLDDRLEKLLYMAIFNILDTYLISNFWGESDTAGVSVLHQKEDDFDKGEI